MTWSQHYAPLADSIGLSALVAALPVATLLALLAFWNVRAHLAALAGLLVAAAIAIGVYGMPLKLTLASAGVLFPFFSPLLGWLGVAVTGSNTSSNVLFGNLQKVTAQQLDLSPILTAASNSSGGVIGKIINAQSIVVAQVAIGGQKDSPDAGTILRAVFWHSVAAGDPHGHSGHAPGLRFQMDDRDASIRRVMSADGIHQWMNPWISVATYRRDCEYWGLLIAGLIQSAISRPCSLLRRQLAGGDFLVSSIDETHPWFHSVWPPSIFGCGCRVGKFPG